MPTIGVVDQANGHVTDVVQIAVKRFVQRPIGSFDDVAEYVNTSLVIQSHSFFRFVLLKTFDT